MPWTAQFQAEQGFVEVTLKAPVSAADMKDATAKAIAMGKERGTTKFLADASESVMTATLFDIFSLPAHLHAMMGADRASRIALLEPKSPRDLEAVRFYETACRNRGWYVKLFPDRPSALDWLLRQDEPGKPA